MALVDELWSGVAVAGAPSVERELALSHRGYAFFAFALPLVAAAAIEAGVLYLSDGWSRRKVVVAGQAILACALAAAGARADPWTLTIALAAAGASSGVACGAAQALLLTAEAESADRTLVRWALYGALGDVLTPLVTAAALGTFGTYRAAMSALAAVALGQCAFSAAVLRNARDGSDVAPAAEAEVAPLRVALAGALRLPRLWAWLFAAASCTLLDELVIVLAVLRLTGERGAHAAVAAAASVAFSAGAVAGTRLTDRVLSRLSPRRVLACSAACCAVALAGLLAAHGIAATCLALFATGIACAPHHPLSMARAFDELPGAPGSVQALGQLFVVVDIGAPLALGAIADHFGVGAAIVCLFAQPAIVAATVALARPAKC